MHYKFCFPCKIKGDDEDIFCVKCGKLLTRVDDLPLNSNEPSEEKLKDYIKNTNLNG